MFPVPAMFFKRSISNDNGGNMHKIGKIGFGILIGIICTMFVCIMMSVAGNSRQSASKNSYYDACDFDFIIPKPWYTQIQEIQDKDFVLNIVPYYMITNKVLGNGNACDVQLFMIEKSYGMNNTAYADSLLVEGTTLSDGTIVIDERTRKNLHVNVGDDVSLTIGETTFTLKVSGVSRDNILFNYPTSAICYDDAVKREIEASSINLSYSAAYVKASDISAAESYFTREYRAMGKVGERSWYESDDAYNFMKTSIENQSFAREVINVSQLRAAEKANASEKKKNEAQVRLVTLILLAGGNLLFWLLYVLLSSKGYRERIKAGTTQKSVVSEFVLGEAFTLIAFAVCMYLLKWQEEGTGVIPYAAALFVSFVIVVLLTNKIVCRKKRPASK